MGRILVIRGGALGDFILTLPAIRLLREAFPEAHLEILGYPQFVEVANAAGLVDATRSIEYARLAPFFARQTILDPDLIDYFASFQVIVSYLFDPDRHFADNLARSGADTLLQGVHKPCGGEGHASLQLTKPLESLALFAEQSDLRGPLSLGRRVDAPESRAPGILALHPGSGSAAKNWPVENWIALAQAAIAGGRANEILLITGEVEAAADTGRQILAGLGPSLHCRHLDQAPLTEVGEALETAAAFVGNDSGVTHLAGALGIPTIALFGPTDPETWSPWGEQVTTIRADSGRIADIALDRVLEALS